jgi:hypothetical protein
MFNESRRNILRQAACGFGMFGLRAMLAEEAAAPLAPKNPHFIPQAKRVIFLFMHGGPSHMDTFDPKPLLDRDHGKPLPFKRPLTFAEGQTGSLFRSPWKFKQYGQSGLPVSELFPNVATCIDDICVLRSMVGDSVAHGGAVLQLHTGSNTFTRPGMGAWVVYGLGTENQNLPAYITIKPGLSHGGAKNWSSAFLPAAYQGTAVAHGGIKVDELKEPIEYLENKGLTREQQRYELDMLQKMNHASAERWRHNPELEARIQAFELAFRMQTQAPEAFDLSRESEATKKLYGMDAPETYEFGWQCLLARRLAERGVRYIQCTHSYKWDQHGQLFEKHNENAKEVDKPIAGLLRDLKSRGLLKDTLVIFRRDAGTGIGDCDADLAAGGCYDDANVTAGWGVPEGVAEQVLQHPANQAEVGRDGEGGFRDVERHRAVLWQGLGCGQHAAD